MLKSRHFLGLLLVVVAVFTRQATAADRPNILLVLCDDLGYGDLACFGDKSLHDPQPG